jgi:hypothetical protein
MSKFNEIPTSKTFNVNTSHPLIPNEQQYILYKKYISIHSEDRDSIKYPNASSFEIEMPEDILNILSVKLVNWSFPSNYNTFSPTYSNVTMTFKINNPFNPSDQGYSIPLYDAIFNALFLNKSNNYSITIEPGFYNPIQMVTELTNKFNKVVNDYIVSYFNDTTTVNYDPTLYPQLLTEFINAGGYTNFVIVYNSVSQQIWFGNKTDGFILTNTTQFTQPATIDNIFCIVKNQLPDFSNWGLPGYLGLSKCDTESINSTTINNDLPYLFNYDNTNTFTPRFFYGNVMGGDDGFWLLPNPFLPGSQVNWIECPFKINFMGPAYFYIEIDGLNCIDETSPFNISEFTSTSNKTNGVVNSSFAKIAIPSTPISQWFDRDSLPYKLFAPPAERIRKLKFKLRYHNGLLVDFGLFNWSIMLEFNTLLPQQQRVFTPSLLNLYKLPI